ncbi:hypothetical protein ATCC90586_000599 [Pythium insidiosum]|nr:hypothetical protein ATCC90586_000599 [Pythium insidiosum]
MGAPSTDPARADSVDSSSASASASAYRPPPVSLSDDQLTGVARDTAVNVDWERLLRIKGLGPTGWKWLETVGDMDVYSRQESQRFAVLAIGVLPCSWREIRRVIHAQTTEEHLHSMEALYGSEFTQGAVAHTVPVEPGSVAGQQRALAHLSVKTATFGRSRWLSTADEWCFVDALHLHDDDQGFEQHLTSLSPKHVFEGRADQQTKAMTDVVVAYKVATAEADETEKPGKQTASRVYFYGEVAIAKALSASWRLHTSEKSCKARLIRMAHACNRLFSLVRRRRLGMQVFIDRTRKHDRERPAKGSSRMRLESVRICQSCMDRVDAADYDNVTKVQPDVVTHDSSDVRSPAALLTDLLQTTLEEASSPTRRESVITVIRNVLDDSSNPESSPEQPTARRLSRTESVVLVDDNALTALKTRLTVPLVDAKLCEADRPYLLHPGGSPTTAMLYPIPENEDQRLEAIEASGLREMKRRDELDIICDLVRKELECFLVVITLIDKDQKTIVASSPPEFTFASFPRSETMCAHTIMTTKPLVVAHPEADVRFSSMGPTQELGIRFYCGFPLTGVGGAVIGTLCFIDSKSRTLSDAQFAAVQRLGETASRVIRVLSQRSQE